MSQLKTLCDIQPVINSIAAMTLEAPESLLVIFDMTSSVRELSILVLERHGEKKRLLRESVYIDLPMALEDAILMESRLAEIIIEAKDSAEAAA